MKDYAIEGKFNLNLDLLTYLYKIGLSDLPCGIIDNESNRVEFRNKASISQLKAWSVSIENTQRLWHPDQLRRLQQNIRILKNGENFERTYNLIIPRFGQIHLTDKFTRIETDGKIKRVFEQLSCQIIR